MNTEHTKGPWKVDEAQDLPLAVIVDNENGDGICEIGAEGTRRDDPETPSSIEAEANARLIAAAPELLEACIALLGECRAYRAQGNAEEPYSANMDRAVDIVRKVKGE